MIPRSILFLMLSTLLGPGVRAAPRVDFARDVQPVLRVSCYGCHGPERQMAGLRLDLRKFALQGRPAGPAIRAGHGAESPLVRRLLGAGGVARMPLNFPPLPSAQIDRIRDWIDQGAIWPAAADLKPADHWAYKRPVRPPLPAVLHSSWARNPIDRFILARLEKLGLSPSPEAPRETLIRRVTLDLIGLPPTLDEIDAFVRDRSPNAYERVVDRLLASAHYGERWARPWLDLARYADTNGYEKDERRSIWKYRDWVIDAYNRDMPFTEFTLDQIAGDMLPQATIDEKVATGFHRNTMFNAEGGVDRDEQRWITQLDRVGTTASVWLGSTLQCAQCHNHKYDPFQQKEFYKFLAFFDHSDEPELPMPSRGQAAQVRSLDVEVARLKARVDHAPPGPKAAPDATAAWMKDRIAALEKRKAALPIPTTLVMAELPDNLTPSTYVRVKGAYLVKAEKVTAGTPSVLPPMTADEPPNRLGLARWLVDPRNPLVARVTVNRYWEQLFGRGIVETSEDFGTQGSPPTHPELLDWLATEFMRDGWRTKAIQRLIVTSATYRQSSRITAAMRERDPKNQWLERGPRFRMEAEMIRDAALSAAGLLSPRIGGPSVFPDQPDGVWSIPYNGDQWVTSVGEDRYRRGLYTFWRRTSPYPAFLTFDATSREFCTVRRIRTTTPLQALTTLNDTAFFNAARGLARRMKTLKETRDRLTLGFRLCASRRPEPRELSRLAALYAEERSIYRADPASARAMLGLPPDRTPSPMKSAAYRAALGAIPADAAGAPPSMLPALPSKTAPEAAAAMLALVSGAKREPATPEVADLAALTMVANVLLNLDETLTKE